MKVKLCQRCHHEFSGNTIRCPDCLNKMKINRSLLKNKREAAGVCNHCGKPIEDNNFKTCNKCRHGIYKINKKSKQNTKKNVTIEEISNLLMQSFKKFKTKNSYIIMNDLKVKLELLGVKYSNDICR